MSVYETAHRPRYRSDEKLAILELVLQRNSVRLSALVEAFSLDDADAHEILSELRADDLVSACRLDEDDLIVTSLPRLRDYERTKIHRLVYN